VPLLARLGGWTVGKDRKPGKIVLIRGLRRPADIFAAQAFLNRLIAAHDHLPLGVSYFLQDMAQDA
jgi:hypothetical protein